MDRVSFPQIQADGCITAIRSQSGLLMMHHGVGGLNKKTPKKLWYCVACSGLQINWEHELKVNIYRQPLKEATEESNSLRTWDTFSCSEEEEKKTTRKCCGPKTWWEDALHVWLPELPDSGDQEWNPLWPPLSPTLLSPLCRENRREGRSQVILWIISLMPGENEWDRKREGWMC